MIISSKLEGKKFKNGVELPEDSKYSYYNYIENGILIYLPEVLKHSVDCSIEQAFTQHVTHELIHKLLMTEIGFKATKDWDNLGSNRVLKIEGHFTLKDWYGGMLNKEV